MKEIKDYITSEAKRKYAKKYYIKNRERILLQRKEYVENHREEIRKSQKRYRMAHDRSEYMREYYRAAKEKKNDKRVL